MECAVIRVLLLAVVGIGALSVLLMLHACRSELQRLKDELKALPRGLAGSPRSRDARGRFIKRNPGEDRK